MTIVWNPFGAGNNPYRSSLLKGSLYFAHKASSNAGSTAARDAVKQATAAVVDALGKYNPAVSVSSDTTTGMRTYPVTAVQGYLARLNPVGGAFSTLRATQAVNTRITTNRASMASLGLNFGTAVSTLKSSVLGLDVTSPSAKSTLSSFGSLGLDTTSPTAASSLKSSSAIGLDLTSPDRASELESSQQLALDVASPETASQLDSAALGLDLASPDAASSLQSSSNVGLDVTSPETASTLDSSASLGLDITSPETASQLASNALGLDLTSPDAASYLRSSSVIGLDVTSAERASTLDSSASLGLDITSPERASVLSSSATLGLDVTSAERASVLSSSAVLGLDVTTPQAASTITSMAAVVTSSTNYDPSVTIGTSTSVATLSGVYTGVNTAASTSTLTVKMMANSTVSGTASSVHFQILDGATKLLDYTGNLKAGDKVYLGDDIGLSISFSAGSLVNGQVGTSSVSHTAPTVNTAATFNNADPDLRPKFDNNAQVTAGSFVVNGQTITVAANDTIASVITKINSSSAGVTAAFDTGTNKMTLTTTAFSEDNVYLSGDTSGFLSAMKLVSPNEEMNTATTSYTPTASFAGLSTSSITLSGTYTGVGAYSAVTGLTIKYAGVLTTLSATSASTVKFSVLDQANHNLFSFNGTAKAGDRIAIDNDTGLWVSFSAGSLVANDTATVAVSNTTKTDIDLTAAFNASANTRPRFENGMTVSAGSFTVNGVSISVVANDSVNSVLAKINASSAGVTASVAAGSDKITITNNSGSNPVLLANDTSGFLAATKLSRSTTVKGNVRDDLQVLAKTTQFSSVTTGSFSINGTSISVNKDTDSVSTIVARINASAAGVTATYNSSLDKVVLTTTSNTEDLITVSGDTSGFATAAKLSSNNTVRGNIKDDQQVLAKTTQFGSVTNGSFSINGASISVDKDTDTLSTIIARINASAAGVTATYDSVADKVVLTTLGNTEDLITVSGDTSGFATAAKLSTNNTVRGNIRDDQQVLAKTTQFGSVTTGSFTINGATISVNKDTDTVTSLIARINASAAGVTASFDSVANKLHLVTNANTEDLITVSSDTSGFLTAAKWSTANTVRGNIRDDQQALSKMSQFAGVTSGSFTIDGTSIAFDTATDTVSSLIARITASNAGVTAAYDSAADKLTLTSKTNTEDLITVSDSTGLLNALHLATNNTVRGHLSEDGVALKNLAGFSSVTNGSFVLDGHTISVSTNDSVNDIVSRINTSGARATAVFDTTANRIVLTTTYITEDNVDVGSDTSGFLAAAGISAGNTVKGNLRDDQQVLAKTSQFGSVTTGSFTINGATISVNKDTDTVTSLIDRINASAAGVTASFDSVADKLHLVTNTISEDLITVASDTSGFLAAAKWDTNNTVRGNIRDDQQVLSKMAQFAGVTSGSLTINGTSIAFNTATDTVSSIIARITASNAGVTAAYDSAADRVTLTSKTNTEDLIALNDSTGLLDALHLATENTVRGHLSEDGVALKNLSQFSSVTNGSFILDGQTIVVSTNDSVNDIVGRINTSGARVTAEFDAASDRVKLVTTYNTEDNVAIGGDTSGFLAAAGISAENTVKGNLRDDQQVLAKTSQFGAVTDGSFTINGVSIAVNAATDSLESIVSQINGANAGVTAAYDSASDVLRLTATTNSETLIQVGGDTSGFLSAAHLDTSNTVRGHVAEDGVALQDLAEFAGVSNGSFTVDGKTISVNVASDSIRTIVDRINGSGARVIAQYDAATDRVQLDATYDSEDLVPIGDDTSGFLSAAHLDANDTVRGNLRDDLQVLAKTSQFGSVTSGTFSVNGVQIAVDSANDSLADVVARINGAAAGVSAVFDAGANAVRLTTTSDSEDLITVGNDTTGFLAAAQLDTDNTARGNIADDRQVLAKTSQFGNVTSGSFSLNGVTINVDAQNDSLADVVSRMNDAGVDVDVAYDAGTDRITLARRTIGQDLIDIQGDTSGFLAAAGLDASNGVAGRLADDTEVLARTEQFGGVTDGSFSLNGHQISVSASADNLQDVIARMNAANAGVSVQYNALTDTVDFTPSVAGAPLSILGDTSGLLSALHIAEGTQGTHVNVNAAFNATGLAAPMFDDGRSVVAGSFTVNGVNISVAADDTVSAVLARINHATAAGVTVAFDAPTQTVKFTAKQKSASPIALASDTSGFLSAMKLDTSAESIAGADPVRSTAAALSSMPEYGSVHAGTLTANGVAIAIDPAHTTLDGLLHSLSAVDGITASINPDSGAFQIGAQSGSKLSLSDTSGILSALGITPASLLPRVVRGADSQTSIGSNATSIAQDVSRAVATLNSTLARYAVTGSDVQHSLAHVLDMIQASGAHGISFDVTASSPKLSVDTLTLARSLDAGGAVTATQFQSGGAGPTLLAPLVDRLADMAGKVGTDPVSSLVDAAHAARVTSS